MGAHGPEVVARRGGRRRARQAAAAAVEGGGGAPEGLRQRGGAHEVRLGAAMPEVKTRVVEVA